MAERPPIRLIAVDVDGTLVDDNKQIPEANRRALRAAIDRGVGVAIASGRMVQSIELLEARLAIDCALIAYNGGMVVGPKSEGRQRLFHQPLPASIADLVCEFALRRGYVLNYYLDEILYTDETLRDGHLGHLYAKRSGMTYEFTDLARFAGRDPTKLILLAEPEEAPALRDRFAVDFSGAANVVITEPKYVEFMAPGVNKSTALPTLAVHYGVGLDEVLVVGDADNDREMVEAAGLGVAVANARPSVLDVADVVTERTNNEGAVAEAVARWVLAGEEIDFWGETNAKTGDADDA